MTNQINELITELENLRKQVTALQDQEDHYQQIAKALQLSEAKNKALLKAIPDILFRLDKDGRFLDYHAPKTIDLFKLPSQFLGKNVNEVMPPPLAKQTKQAISQALQTNQSQIYEYCLPDKTGTLLDFEARMVVSGVEEVLVLIRNITERKQFEYSLQQQVIERTQALEANNQRLQQEIAEREQAQEAHYKNERLLKAIIDSAPAHIAYIDKEKKLLLMNKLYEDSYRRFYNLEPKDLIGKNINESLPYSQRRNISHLDDQALSGKQVSFTQTYRSPDNNEAVTAYGIYNPHFNEQGEVEGYVTVVLDITERVKAEEALRQAKEFAELAQKEAERANKAKSEFLANMSHELRTPLNGILGYTQLLQKDRDLTPKQQEGIAIIQRSGEHLLTLINDILDLSKIEAAKMEVQSNQFNLPKLLQSIVELFQVRAQQKGITFEFEQVSNIPIGVEGDEKRLRQVLLNLLSNAIKFTEKGGVIFKVGTIIDEETMSFMAQSPYHHLRFQVEDSGVGIESQELENIFQPFRQVGKYSKVTEGTGLGLAISKRLTIMMKGELQVKSTLGLGSTFWLDLTLKETPVFDDSYIDDKPLIVGYTGSPCKVLVVDDKPENRSILVHMLTPLGFVVAQAINGQTAIEKTLELNPDIILMDLRMPQMDGFEAIRLIRTLMPPQQTGPDYDKSPRIIAISASAFEHNRQASIEAGADDFIAKPFRFEKLLTLFEKHISLKWVYNTLSSTPPNSTSPTQVEHSSIQNSITISNEQLELLLDLTKRGNIRQLQQQLDRLSQTNGATHPFIKRLKTLAQDFKFREIKTLLQTQQTTQ